MELTAIRTQDPATKTYLGSPSIVRLPSGELLVTHDYFGPGCPRNHDEEEHLSSVYRSRNMCPRNTLSLHASADLLTWTPCQTLLEDDLGLSCVESMRKTGFQYADWVFHGNDILAAVRTAYSGAHNLHDANMITYHRVRDFRRAIGPWPQLPNKRPDTGRQ